MPRNSDSMNYSHILFILAFLTSCSKQENHTSFYHWKQNFNLDSTESKLLKDTGTEKLYIRFFDVTLDENGNPKPVSKVDIEYLPNNLNIIPTIYIVNKVFKNSKLETSKILSLINEIADYNKISFSEIQIDCDWTVSTKSNYFAFLNELKALSKKQISTTIRLHQIKDKQLMGIPPANKGVLMFYNNGNIYDIDSKNSILEPTSAISYLKDAKSYHLDLDLALPIYSWILLYRKDRIIDIFEYSSIDSLKFSKLSLNTYKANYSSYSFGKYIYENDILKIEKSKPDSVLKALEIFDDYYQKNFNIIYYHLDKKTINEFGYQNILNISSN